MLHVANFLSTFHVLSKYDEKHVSKTVMLDLFLQMCSMGHTQKVLQDSLIVTVAYITVICRERKGMCVCAIHFVSRWYRFILLLILLPIQINAWMERK